MSQDARFWAAMGRTAFAFAGWGALTVLALLVWRPLAVLPSVIAVGVAVIGARRAGRVYEEDRNKRLAGRPKAVGWREEWRQDWAEVASDPSVELWRKHPGIALLSSAFAVASAALLIYLRAQH